MVSDIKLRRIPPELEKYVNRINIMQIISSGKVTVYTMQAHIDRIIWFYRKAIQGLTQLDISGLRRALIDFYKLIGLYTEYNGFAVRNLDKIGNQEWCTLVDFRTLLNRGALKQDFIQTPLSLNRIIQATTLIIKAYYSIHKHTTIDIYELSHELDHDLYQ